MHVLDFVFGLVVGVITGIVVILGFISYHWHKYSKNLIN